MSTVATESALDRLEWEKLRLEQEVYASLLPALLKTHEGEYVALHEGAVIATGTSLRELYVQVYTLLDDIPVLFRRVSAEPEPDLRIRSPRLYDQADQMDVTD